MNQLYKKSLSWKHVEITLMDVNPNLNLSNINCFALCKMASNANLMTLYFYTYVMLKMLYAHDSVMMSVYDITENIL